jgi:hypothetical protein
MFPIGKSKLSLREIANYWARDEHQPASQNELLQELEAAWWLGQIRGDTARLDFLKRMFKAMHDRDDAGVVFFVKEAGEPPPKMEQLSDGSIQLYYRPSISLPSKDISTWDESNCEDAFQSLAQTSAAESYPEMTYTLYWIELTFEEFTKWLVVRGYPKPKFWRPLPATDQPKTAKRRRGSLERAQRAIAALFPEPVPDQVLLPNKVLCGRVHKWLEKSGLPKISDETILRAAGRRRK